MTVFIVDFSDSLILEVIGGNLYEEIGNGIRGYSGDGGPAGGAELNYPASLAIDAIGNRFIADNGNCRIRQVSTIGIISTVAGSAIVGFLGDGGSATSAALYYPKSVAVDANGNLFIYDDGNFRIRKVSLNNLPSLNVNNVLPVRAVQQKL